MASSNPISFKELKQRISIEQVFRHYNLFDGLQLRGKSHRGSCPFCEVAEGNPFSVSLEKNCYQCFTCKASGNILDFVSRWEGVSIREASQVLTKNFVEKEPHMAAKTTEEESPPSGEAGERADKTCLRRQVSSAQAPAATPPQGEPLARNEPLTFTLKNIDPDHPSVKALGIHEDTITAFGVGYYTGKGMMENRIVIPIHNQSQQLVAYAGFHPEDRTYTYPPKFNRGLELYNLSGALADVGADTGVILVRHPLDALALIAAGYLNAVAVMGDTVSEEQVQVLLTEYEVGTKVTLFWPLHVDIVPPLDALFPKFFIRLRRYEEQPNSPTGFTAEVVRDLIE